VCIELGGQDRLVTEHLLHCSQVCTTLDQVSRKGMSKCMRTHNLSNPSIPGQLLDDIEDHHPAKCLTPPIEEDKVSMPGFDIDLLAFVFGVLPDHID